MAFVAEFGGKVGDFFTRNKFYKEGDVFNKAFDSFKKKCNNKDLYICAYKYEQNKDGTIDIKTSRLLSDIYFDFDSKIDSDKEYSKLKASVLILTGYLYKEMSIPSNQLKIYFSGSKGFHVIIPATIFSLEPSVNLNKEIEKFVKYCMKNSGTEYIDTQIYDRRRLFRVPGSINAKSGLYKVPVTLMQLSTYSYEKMKEWSSQLQDEPDEWEEPVFNAKAKKYWGKIQAIKETPKEYKEKKLFKTKYPLLPCAKAILENGVSSGQRNVAGIALASSIIQSGTDIEDVLSILKEWNQKNEPPMNEHEVNSLYMSARRMAENGMMYGCNSFKQMDFCLDDCKFNIR